MVLRLAERLLCPVLCFCPLLSENSRLKLARDHGRGKRFFLTWPRVYVLEAELLHPVGVRLVGGKFRPFVRYLIFFDV